MGILKKVRLSKTGYAICLLLPLYLSLPSLQYTLYVSSLLVVEAIDIKMVL